MFMYTHICIIYKLTNINGLISLCERTNHPVIFSKKCSVDSQESNPFCISLEQHGMCQEIVLVEALMTDDGCFPLPMFACFSQTCSFPGNWRKRWVALSIEVRLNVPHPFLQAGVEGLVADSECKSMCMFDLLKLYQECWCRQKHTFFIRTFLPPRCFSHFWIPFEVSTLVRLLNDSFRTPVAFRSRSMVKKNVQSWD